MLFVKYLFEISYAAKSDSGFQECLLITRFSSEMEVETYGDDNLLSLTSAAVASLSGPRFSRVNPPISEKAPVFSPIRSRDQALHDDSVASRISQSDRSIDQSAFLHGKAQVVKVAAKKLREIKSPFDAHVQSSYDSVLRDSHEQRHVTTGTPRDHDIGTVVETSVLGGGSPADSLQTRIAVEKHAAPRSTDTILARSNNSLGQSLGKTATSDDVMQTISDSGFASHNVRIVRETQQPPALRTLNSTSAELPSLFEEGEIETNIVVAQHGKSIIMKHVTCFPKVYEYFAVECREFAEQQLFAAGNRDGGTHTHRTFSISYSWSRICTRNTTKLRCQLTTQSHGYATTALCSGEHQILISLTTFIRNTSIIFPLFV